MTDRELLEQLAAFINKRPFIQGDAGSIGDMVKRYQHPPFTRHFQVAMQMTVTEHRQLESLMQKINAHLTPEPATVTNDH